MTYRMLARPLAPILLLLGLAVMISCGPNTGVPSAPAADRSSPTSDPGYVKVLAEMERGWNFTLQGVAPGTPRIATFSLIHDTVTYGPTVALLRLQDRLPEDTPEHWTPRCLRADGGRVMTVVSDTGRLQPKEPFPARTDTVWVVFDTLRIAGLRYC